MAHALPQGAFAGAAGASLIGLSTILGLGVFSVLGALGIGWLGRRGRHDVATALALVVMLGLGAMFLSLSTEYSSEIFSLLFGEVLGVARDELLPIAALSVVTPGRRRRPLPSPAALARPCPRSARPAACGPTAWTSASSSWWPWPPR